MLDKRVEINSRDLQKERSKIERSGNVTTISKPEGTYSIIYGTHITSMDPKSITDNVDGVFLESGLTYPINYPLATLHFLRDRVQYKDLFPTFEKQRIPLFLADVYYNFSGGNFDDNRALDFLIGTFQNVLPQTVETAIGAALIGKFRSEIRNRKISRRDFLKLGVKSALAVWLFSPVVSNAITIANTETNASIRAAKDIQKASDRLHPEKGLLLETVRDVVITHKEQFIMERKGGRPHMATIVGAFHVGIEDSIQSSPQERLEFLRAMQPLLRHIVVPETFYQIAELQFDGQHWKEGAVTEVPELKELVTN